MYELHGWRFVAEKDGKKYAFPLNPDEPGHVLMYVVTVYSCVVDMKDNRSLLKKCMELLTQREIMFGLDWLLRKKTDKPTTYYLYDKDNTEFIVPSIEKVRAVIVTLKNSVSNKDLI
jgi:hypothetical protein